MAICAFSITFTGQNLGHFLSKRKGKSPKRVSACKDLLLTEQVAHNALADNVQAPPSKAK